MTVPIVFDRKLYAARRLRAERIDTDSFLVLHAADNIAERLRAVKRGFVRALDLTSRRQSAGLLRSCAERWVSTGLRPRASGITLVADEEALPFAPHSFDLIVSVLGLHAANDLPGALVQIRNALVPGGLFLAALFGGATLKELRTAFAAGEVEQTGGASLRVAPFADVRDMGALLQRAGFESCVADVDTVPARYGSLPVLFGDLRALGETNALALRRRTFLSRGVLSAMLRNYRQSYGIDGKLVATFEILYLTGWAPGAEIMTASWQSSETAA